MGAETEKRWGKYLAMLKIAVDEARAGLSEGGIPIGAALFDGEGKLLGRGHNRRVQEGDPSAHGRPTPFEKRAVREVIATRLWSQRSRRAGIAAA